MILLTGATGLVGSALLQRLLDAGADVRCLVRDPRRLGPNRVRVQITLGDLSDPVAIRQAMRGAASVVHLGAAIRDQPQASIEEINAVATIRLLREAERAGVDRFVFFSAMCATTIARTRFFRAKALAEQAVLAADLDVRVAAPSIIYAPGDPWFTLLGRMTLLPWMPVSGSGHARFEPIWVEDAADCAQALLDGDGRHDGNRFELAGPDRLTYEQIVRLAMEAAGRRRPIVHVPLPAVRRGLDLLGRVVGPSVFATWEEVELFEESMTSTHGTSDVRALGVSPKPMKEVLGLETIPDFA